MPQHPKACSTVCTKLLTADPIMQPAQGNVGVAFALVIGAGLSTTLGACAAFFAKLASPRLLAMGLGLSAGVMLCALLSIAVKALAQQVTGTVLTPCLPPR